MRRILPCWDHVPLVSNRKTITSTTGYPIPTEAPTHNHRFCHFAGVWFCHHVQVPRLLCGLPGCTRYSSVYTVYIYIPWASTTIKIMVDPISMIKTLGYAMVVILTPIVLMVVGIPGYIYIYPHTHALHHHVPSDFTTLL